MKHFIKSTSSSATNVARTGTQRDISANDPVFERILTTL
eukprot:CAMPEP_0185602874 /NCGR_PEP_ID=MMETSP0436-20130131/2065_1 /TAXON_ID=626734 ORGANISM="Favella taraikaensis, Strain Fe Narragansett Bay" /NCGR_SAMPLE_ID=MMETSP0436 /ASSEMBLY_ACC=CAM_ASM_000390 /LENGTH=38 /DNA_ID= /DNA_START= /DNA_END= /DNA_ORIENTATION=